MSEKDTGHLWTPEVRKRFDEMLVAQSPHAVPPTFRSIAGIVEPEEDERLPVTPEVMALLESDFPEAAGLFQVYPELLEWMRTPMRVVFGMDLAASQDEAELVAMVERPQRLWSVPPGREEGDIREDERRLICAREGHNEVDATELGSSWVTFWCVRCGHRRLETRCGCRVQYPPVTDVDGNHLTDVPSTPIVIHNSVTCPEHPESMVTQARRGNVHVQASLDRNGVAWREDV